METKSKVGHPAVYRPKVKSLTLQLSQRGVDALAAARRRSTLSPSDIFDQLLRRFGRDIVKPAQETHV